jgi:hypothetical protein
MVIEWSASLFEMIIYLLCVATSLLCAYLLVLAYRANRTSVLIWSAMCFGLLAMNNLIIAIDILLLPTIDLTIVQLTTSLAAAAVLLYGFIWKLE